MGISLPESPAKAVVPTRVLTNDLREILSFEPMIASSLYFAIDCACESQQIPFVRVRLCRIELRIGESDRIQVFPPRIDDGM